MRPIENNWAAILPQGRESITPLTYEILPDSLLEDVFGSYPCNLFPDLSTFDEQDATKAFERYTRLYKNDPITGTVTLTGTHYTYSDGSPVYEQHASSYYLPTIGFSDYYIASRDLEHGRVSDGSKYTFAAQKKAAHLTVDHATGNSTLTHEFINYSVDIENANFYNIIREAYYTGNSLSALAPGDEDLKQVYVASFKEISHMVPPPGYNPEVGPVSVQSYEAYVDVNTCCFSLYGQADLDIVARHVQSISDFVIQPTDRLGVDALGGKSYVKMKATRSVDNGIPNADYFDSENPGYDPFSIDQFTTARPGNQDHGYYRFDSLFTYGASGVSASDDRVLTTGVLLNNPSTVVGGTDYVEAAALAYNKVKPHTWRRACRGGSLVAATYNNYFTGAVYLFGLKYNGKTGGAKQSSLRIPTTNTGYNIEDKYLLGAALDAQAVRMFWGTISPAVLADIKPCVQIYSVGTGQKIVVPVVDIRTDGGIGITYGVLKEMFPKFNTKAETFYDSISSIAVSVSGVDEHALVIRPAHLGMTLTSDDVAGYIGGKNYGSTLPLIAKGETASRRTFQQIRRVVANAQGDLSNYIVEEAKLAYKNKKLPSNISKAATAVMYTTLPGARVVKILQGSLTVVRNAPEIYINAANFLTDLRNKDAKFSLKKIWIGFKNKAIDYFADMDEIHIIESIFNTAIKIVYKKHEDWTLKATVDAIRKRKADATEGTTITGVIGSSH